MKKHVLTALFILGVATLASCGQKPARHSSSPSGSSSSSSSVSSSEEPVLEGPFLDLDFDEHEGPYIHNAANGSRYYVDYVFNETHAAEIFKAPSDPLYRTGVGEEGKSLYLDGFSNKIAIRDEIVDGDKITMSAWIAPRGYENLGWYGGAGAGSRRMTSIINQGNMELGEGFTFGYSYLGEWGIQIFLHNTETGEDIYKVVTDPHHLLTLYEWNHIAVSFDGTTGYLALFYNGNAAYETILPELRGCEIVPSYESLRISGYCAPQTENGCDRQMPAGLIDNVRMWRDSLSPRDIREEYRRGFRSGDHPSLAFEEVQIDRAQYEGDRYRAIYHGVPPGVWMNEPHAPIYYKGMYHLFYQHDPIGPYWSQIRWAHLVSPDMLHWVAVKDAVVPTPGVCPDGVWTGGSVIGPDGTPWLAITAGLTPEQTTWTFQNIAYAHCVDPDDPYLTDWVVEDRVSLTQPADDSQGERHQFRDPFVWYDDEEKLYYMLVSTSIPNAGGSANIYTSPDMRDWAHHGYVYECDLGRYPEQGEHWECVVMLPIKSKDGSIQKWILFDCPQYLNPDLFVVDCLYWVGQFDKKTCRFIPDDDKPRYFDLGNGIYTGQTGFCYRTEEDIRNGKTRYEDGRTILFALAQGKDPSTYHNRMAGWAHSLAMPVELYLDNDGTTVLREPIKELESIYEDTIFEYSGDPLDAAAMNERLSSTHGDAMEIKCHVSLNPSKDNYKGGLYVRYNPNGTQAVCEKTGLTFSKDRFVIDRSESTVLDYVKRGDSNPYIYGNQREFDLRILIDHSIVEVYIDNRITFTTRVYPKYGNSDYLSFFDDGAGIKVSEMSVKTFGSVYFDETTPSYFGNTGNLE